MKKFLMILLPVLFLSCSAFDNRTLTPVRVEQSKISLPVKVKIDKLNELNIEITVLNESNDVLEINFEKTHLDNGRVLVDEKGANLYGVYDIDLIAPKSSKVYVLTPTYKKKITRTLWGISENVEKLNYPLKLIINLTINGKTEYKVIDLDAK